jgi:hypothetical protein
LEEMGIDTKKSHMYGIAIKGHYSPDIPDIGPFPVLKYWYVVVDLQHSIWAVTPVDFKML